VLIELADPTHKVTTSEMMKLTVPGPKAQYRTLSWKGPTVLWLAGSVQITALIEHFERNDHANLAEIPRHERMSPMGFLRSSDSMLKPSYFFFAGPR
jgi:hypothetical protein